MDEDRVITKLIELDERVGNIEQNMVTKTDNQRVLDLLDGIAKICKDIREDHLQKIKAHLQMV